MWPKKHKKKEAKNDHFQLIFSLFNLFVFPKPSLRRFIFFYLSVHKSSYNDLRIESAHLSRVAASNIPR